MQIIKNLDGSVPGTEISNGSPPGPGKKNRCFAEGPSILVCLLPKGNRPEDFLIKSALLASGITIFIAPNVAELKDHNYELVIAQSCVQLLSTRLQDFILATDYDPLTPARDDVRIHGVVEAQRRA